MDKREKFPHLQELIRTFDAQKEAYHDTAHKVHELLTQSLSPSSDIQPGSTKQSNDSFPRVAEGEAVLPNATVPAAGSILTRGTGEESDDDHDKDELLYAQELLATQNFDHEGLREHLTSYPWDEYGWEVLKDVLGQPYLRNPSHARHHNLFPTQTGPVEDRSHLSGSQVWDVGSDGAPLAVEQPQSEHETSRAIAIWQSIKDVNSSSKERKAVGRITILRELSPILFGALHHVMNNTFDMDEIFKHLVTADSSMADVHRAFDADPRRQCSKLFVFQYFTIVGDDCIPMSWQLASQHLDKNPKHIHITRCSSVVALALTGKPIRKVKNPSRRASGQNSHGNVYDPWSSWHLLNLQCFPDLKSSTDIHESTNHYVNGPEAFLITLLGEFRDAQTRFEDINRAITKLVTPPAEFMFDANIRDDLLFEDEHFTYVRRYFWAYQTLGIMNESIRSIIDEFEHNAVDDSWEGRDKTLWPLIDQEAPRSVYYKKRMAALRHKFEAQMRAFRALIQSNEERRTEIRGLREELYVGTSVKESRQSVEATETTVQQGHNVKLLTLVSIFFLPSQFVTSVWGMTNFNGSYWIFGIVLAAVCVPFFILIGSLNSTRGYIFWSNQAKAVFGSFGKLFAWFGQHARRKRKPSNEEKDDGQSQSAPSDRLRLRRTDVSDDQHVSLGLRSTEHRQTGRTRGLGRMGSSRLAGMLKGATGRQSSVSSEV